MYNLFCKIFRNTYTQHTIYIIYGYNWVRIILVDHKNIIISEKQTEKLIM